MQEMSTLKLYSTDSTVPGKFAEYTVSLKGYVPQSFGCTSTEASTEICKQSDERLMYAVDGVKIAVIGQKIVE